MNDTESKTDPNASALATTTNAVTAMHRKFNIPGDVVFKATQELDDHSRNAIRGLHAWCSDQDLSISEIAHELDMSPATISLVFRGKYEAKLDNVVKSFADFLKLQHERRDSRRLPFIETALSETIFSVCEKAREFQRMAFLYSDSQIGKTEALKEYQRRNNHGATIYVEVPTGGGLHYFLNKICKTMKLGETLRVSDARRRILESFDDRMLLIVDEAHRAIPQDGVTPKTAINTLDFVREIFNERQCGVVICATNVFRDAMENNSVKLILKQMQRRRLCAMQLPTEPSKEDLNTFAAAYGLPPATGHALKVQTERIQNEALGMWLLLLRMSKKLATKRKDKMSWNHVIEADAALKEMEKPV